MGLVRSIQSVALIPIRSRWACRSAGASRHRASTSSARTGIRG